jgi:hypothetical protein
MVKDARRGYAQEGIGPFRHRPAHRMGWPFRNTKALIRHLSTGDESELVVSRIPIKEYCMAQNGTKKTWPKFSAWIRLKDGTVIYAKDYGLKAFPIGKRS